MGKINILVVNKTKLICSIVAAAMRDEPDINVIGYATTVEEALEKAKDCDIMAIDAILPQDMALEITKKVSDKFPDVRILVTGVEEKPQLILTFIEAGASGYVLEEVDVDGLLEGIRAVHNNEAVASPEIISAFMTRLNSLSKLCADIDLLTEKLEELTPREREVLDLLDTGMSNQEIADKLCIEVGTVKNHVHSILKKLEVSSRHEAAAIYERSQSGKDEAN